MGAAAFDLLMGGGKFFDALRPEDPIAIYARTGGASILLQGFTSDHALLRAAVQKVIPRFPPPGSGQ